MSDQYMRAELAVSFGTASTKYRFSRSANVAPAFGATITFSCEVAGALAIIGDVGGYLETVSGAALSAAWFWWETGCNRLADVDNVEAISDLINIGHRTERVGDSIGYDKRLSLTKHCLAVLS